MDFLTKYRQRNSNVNTFPNISPEIYTRYNGGPSEIRNIPRHHPYVSGYWILLLKIPEDFAPVNTSPHYDSTSRHLAARAESFIPPTRLLNFGELIGFGGVKRQIVTGQTTSNTFTISFREYQDLPIYKIFTQWSLAINPFSGHITNKYKGFCCIGFMKPICNGLDSVAHAHMSPIFKPNFEQFIFFEGVSPENQPIDNFDTDISTNESKTMDIVFKFDGAFMDDTFDVEGFYEDFITHAGIKPDTLDTILFP